MAASSPRLAGWSCIFFSLLLAAFSPSPAQEPRPRALFEPAGTDRLLIIGQDLGAIGGFEAPNNNGYTDHVPLKPGGVTTYLSLPWLLGMNMKINFGTGDLWAQGIVESPVYKDSALAIGLHLVGQLERIAAGAQDDRITLLADWVKSTNRPVFLRIGYEFDGSWNKYEPKAYQEAYRHIVKKFRDLKVANCAMVWQSATSPVNGNKAKDIALWYPGDEYVDWVGYSWFLNSKEQVTLTDKLLAFARDHHKPVLVCEAAPQGYDLARLTKGSIFAGKDRKSKTPEAIWKEWYAPFFSYIDANRDVIRVVAYINVNWDTQLMWGPPYRQGYWGDSRVEANEVIKEKWLETMSPEKGWLHASPELFGRLGYEKADGKQ